MADPRKSSKDAFTRITNPDGSPVRDKDNAAPDHKPSYSQRPAPNLAPGGAMGIRQPKNRSPLVPQNDNAKVPKEKIQFRKPNPKPEHLKDTIPSSIVIGKGDSEKDLWIHGNITTMPGYSFVAKVDDTPSKFGIANGKISKLQIEKDGQQVVNYDRGWNKPPRTAEHREAVHRIRKGFDDLSHDKSVKAPNHDKHKGHGMER